MDMGISGGRPARRPALRMFGMQRFRTTSVAALLRFVVPAGRLPTGETVGAKKELDPRHRIFPFRHNAMGLCMTNL